LDQHPYPPDGGLGVLIEFGAANGVVLSPQQQLLLRSPEDSLDIGTTPSVALRLRTQIAAILDLPSDDDSVSQAVADVAAQATVGGALLRELLNGPDPSTYNPAEWDPNGHGYAAFAPPSQQPHPQEHYPQPLYQQPQQEPYPPGGGYPQAGPQPAPPQAHMPQQVRRTVDRDRLGVRAPRVWDRLTEDGDFDSSDAPPSVEVSEIKAEPTKTDAGAREPIKAKPAAKVEWTQEKKRKGSPAVIKLVLLLAVLAAAGAAAFLLDLV
jgi:hypothetical protein